ncbi:ParB/RepB/Spo0J family partition protein [Candidatus Kaiserbacteria bacterium]|nr:ParB/RepB/Spo0J family partition protein [Candidatus Kaiserbacteria bacterium]
MAFQGDSIYWVEVEKVVPNPFQPRREFDQNKLQELSDSIRMYGVLQPLTVTRNEIQREDGTFYTEYELIAGERRLRASKLAGVAQVPVIIREGEQSEQEKLELAIIENLQREDLNAVDRALAFKQLAEVFGLSHVQVAQKVGRSREYVSNSIRLLGLPDHILTALKQAELSEGHARTLLMLNDKPEEQEVIFREILLKKLSVREVERIVRKIATDKVRKKAPGEFDAYLIEFEKQFTETLGTRVQIQKTDFGGKLTIDYFSTDDLAAILKRVRDEEASSNRGNEKEMSARLSNNTPLEVSTPVVSVPEPVVQKEVSEPVSEKSESHYASPATPSNTASEIPKPAAEEEFSLSSFLSRKESAPQNLPQEASEKVDAASPSEALNHSYQAPQVAPMNQAEVKEEAIPTVTAQTDLVQPSVPANTLTPAVETEVQPKENAPAAIPQAAPVQTSAHNHFGFNRYQNHAPHQNNVQAPQTQIPVAKPVEQPPQAPKPAESDDSNLYSIRNFSV